MKFFKKYKFLILIILAVVLSLASTISCATSTIAEENSSNILVESSAETAQPNKSSENAKDLYLFDDSTNIDYSVTGNVFILANNVTISNKILGNVFILAKNVNITSKAYINSSLFVCAENVKIEGDVFDLYSVSNNLSISPNARILRDITASGKSLDLQSSIYRNANLDFSTINIDSNSAKINGNLSYSSKVSSIPQEIVAGEYSFNDITSKQKATNYIQNLLEVLVVSIIVILIIILAMPKFAEKAQKVLKNKIMPSLGYGSIILIITPISCFILFCTIIGILPSLAILFAYIFFLQISSALVSIPLAKIICNKMNKNIKWINIFISILLVSLIWLLEQIPILGKLISLFISILGLGILSYTIIPHKK